MGSWPQRCGSPQYHTSTYAMLVENIKGTVSRDFLRQVFLWITFPQAPDNNIRIISNFFEIRGDIRKSRCTTGVVDTGGKFATGVKDAGGKLPPVSMTPVANNGNNIWLQTPESELEGKNLYICFLYYPKVTTNKIIKIFLIEDFFHLPPVSLTPVANLELRISPRIFEKIWNGPNGIIRGLGETGSRKKPEAKNLVTLSL